MKQTVTSAVMPEVPPTFATFLKLNSSPRLNSRKITPSSDQTLMLSSSSTVGTNVT